jgi:hypothetical protein
MLLLRCAGAASALRAARARFLRAARARFFCFSPQRRALFVREIETQAYIDINVFIFNILM